jgi:GNAT superfamily N-acetyltransferase
MDRTGGLQTEPLQGDRVAERLGIPGSQLLDSVRWLDESGDVYSGAEAANAAVSAALGTRLPLHIFRIPGVTIRTAATDDPDAIAEIYAHHVRTGVATFELTPPDRVEWLRRFDAIAAQALPFVIATVGGEVAGYAYCAPWKARPAYRHAVENSVYLAPDSVGRGIGGRLLDTLLRECARAGIR